MSDNQGEPTNKPNEKQPKEKKQKVKKDQQQPKDNISDLNKENTEQKRKQQQTQTQNPPGKKPQQQQQAKKSQQQSQGKKGQQQKQAPKKSSAFSKPEQKEDVFQAVLLADNFSCSIFGPECPNEILQEGLLQMLNRKLVDYSLESLTASGVQEVFIYCSTQAESFRKYFQNSKWASLPGASIKLIIGEDALSLGDALRDLDAKGVLRGDFILMNAGVICNLNLRSLLNIHRENVKKDKGAVMTLVHRKLLPGHRSRSKLSTTVVVVEASTEKIIAYDGKMSGDKLYLPIGKIEGEVNIYMDSVDTGIIVCSPIVPPLFSDNFDFTKIQDIIKEVMVNEEILGNSVYFHRLSHGYANRVVDYETFEGIRSDILERWTYPSVPEVRFGFDSDKNSYVLHPNFVYKAESVQIRGVHPLNAAIIGSNSEIGANSEVHFTGIGSNCKIGKHVQLFNCQIGDDVIIPDGSHISKCIIGNGTVLKNQESLENTILMNGERFLISAPVVIDSERKDSDSSSESTESSEGSEQLHIDKDFQNFSNEVLESLIRGFQENVATENLVLEINSSKFAYNMTFKEVTTSICKGTLLVATKANQNFYEKSTKVQWEKTREVILKLKSLFANYIKTKATQMDLLEALEEYANDTPQFRPMLMQTLHLMYDEDILTEDSILEWHKDTSLYEAGSELRILVAKFIEWLEAEDSDSESEED